MIKAARLMLPILLDYSLPMSLACNFSFLRWCVLYMYADGGYYSWSVSGNVKCDLPFRPQKYVSIVIIHGLLPPLLSYQISATLQSSGGLLWQMFLPQGGIGTIHHLNMPPAGLKLFSCIALFHCFHDVTMRSCCNWVLFQNVITHSSCSPLHLWVQHLLSQMVSHLVFHKNVFPGQPIP